MASLQSPFALHCLSFASPPPLLTPALPPATANEVVCAEADGHISYYPDKQDCTRYYMCEGERKHHMPCPVNLVFNYDQTVCDWPENVPGCETAIPAGR